MVQFKKGDKVVKFSPWNREDGVWSWEYLTIQSWGKKQGTATRDENGEFVKAQFYVDQINNQPYREHLFLAEGLDIEAKGLELAAACVAWEIEHNVQKQQNPAFYQRGVQESLDKLRNATPQIAPRSELIAKLHARMKAEGRI